MSQTVISELLVRLHEIQRQLSDLNSRKLRGPRMVQTQEKTIQQILEKHEKAKAEYTRLTLIVKEKETTLAQHEAALARRREQMQSAKNNKEFQALKLQLQADEASNGVLADDALEAIEKAEAFAPTLIEIDAELKKVRETLEKTKTTIVAELPNIEADIVRCTERLRAAEKELPREFREFYSRLTQVMGGEEALAPIFEEKFCGGCRQLIPINFIAQVLQGKPVTCKSCGRLLYAPEGFHAR